jgi:hypothetical protein
MMGMIYGFDDFYGPKSMINMVLFYTLSDERAIFYCRMYAILGLCFLSANWLIGMDAKKLAKIDLVKNIAYLAIDHDIAFNGQFGATSEWDDQFYMQFVIIAVNAAVVVYNTEVRRKSYSPRFARYT